MNSKQNVVWWNKRLIAANSINAGLFAFRIEVGFIAVNETNWNSWIKPAIDEAAN